MPKLSSPWRGDFTVDIPRELFDILSKGAIERNSFGHEVVKTKARVSYRITDIRKAKFIFSAIKSEGQVLKKNELLTRNLFCSALERCEVVDSEKKN